MRGLLEKAAGLLFPPRCTLCGKVLALNEWEAGLCGPCKENIPYFPPGRCPRCESVSAGGGFCGACLRTFAFDNAFAAFPYEAVREAIHLFKYRGGKPFGKGLGTLMAAYLLRIHEDLPAQIDMIIPVPLHPKKEKRRGFNQTLLLCGAISEKTGIPVLENGLRRKKDTAPQSLLSVEERKENLRDVFEAAAGVEGKRILLVDDIFTTGTTCNECARALYRAGAAGVCVFCLAAA